VLVLDKEREYFIVPGRSATREAFDGVIDVEELKRVSGAREALDEKAGWKQLEARVKKVQHVATLAALPPYVAGLGMYSNPARAELIRKLKNANGELELLDLRPHLARMRMIKQPVEIEAIQKAIDVTLASLKEITRPSQLAKYAFEYEVEADLTRAFRRRGANGHAFSPIVAGGPRACTLHNLANDAALANDELLTLDVGAEFNHYAADITRTVSLGGKPSRRQRQVHDAVFEAQEFAFSLLKPGALLRDNEKQVEQFIGEKLRELGLIKSITEDAVREYFPHSTSHFMGIDVHDAGDYDQPLKPGTVLTVEPGIYIPEEGIGVRIEDDALITEDGVVNLSAALPRELS
jgi:Xaa-Pro aminopeptidase